jgi:hypothetical protein
MAPVDAWLKLKKSPEVRVEMNVETAEVYDPELVSEVNELLVNNL